MRHQRKPAKVRVGKTSVPVPDIPLQEPILITDLGKMDHGVLWLIRCSSFGALCGVCLNDGNVQEDTHSIDDVFTRNCFVGLVCSTVKIKILKYCAECGFCFR